METEKNKFEGLYIIGWGLSGGFGGARNFEVIKADSQNEADNWAFENACDEYESFVGSNGLREIGEIMEQDGIEDEDEAWEIFQDERETWLDYLAVPYSKEYENKVKCHHYNNKYKEITDK